MTREDIALRAPSVRRDSGAQSKASLRGFLTPLIAPVGIWRANFSTPQAEAKKERKTEVWRG